MVCFFVVDVALATGAKTFADVGYALAGRGGRRAAVLAQRGNLALYMPTALVIVATSLEYVAPSSVTSCNGVYTVVVCGVMYLVLQYVRHWGHASFLAFFTTVMVAVKACGLLPYAFARYSESSHAALPFGAPSGIWSDYGLAVSSVAFAISPNLIAVELLAEVREPRRFKEALLLSTGFMILLRARRAGNVVSTPGK